MCEALVQSVWEFKQATLESQSCLPECTLACALARTVDLRGLVNCARFNFLCFFYSVFLQSPLRRCIAPQVSCASLLRWGKIKLLKVNLSIPPCLRKASRSRKEESCIHKYIFPGLGSSRTWVAVLQLSSFTVSSSSGTPVWAPNQLGPQRVLDPNVCHRWACL